MMRLIRQDRSFLLTQTKKSDIAYGSDIVPFGTVKFAHSANEIALRAVME